MANLKDFAQKVEELRKAQKAYFRKRETPDLLLSKQLEREVDKAVEEILRGKQEALL